MQEGQDWCLQCGTGRPRSLSSGPGWRTGVAILGATALLVTGASVAAYAALNKTKHKVASVAVASKTPGTATPPAGTPTTTPVAPGTTTPTTPTTPGGAAKAPGLPATIKATPPKIPLQTPTPKSLANNTLFPPETTKSTESTNTTESSKTTGGTTKGASETTESSKTTGGKEPPSPILLDTNAASTYNPYAYSPTLFGDPSLAIDGEEKTAWTANVDPAKTPKMAEGLVLDMKTAQKVASATIKTTTTGVTVEMYGSNGHNLPASITDRAWKRLTGSKVLKKKSTTLKLKTGGKTYRFVVLWITKAPAGSTAAAPGQAAVTELELFP